MKFLLIALLGVISFTQFAHAQKGMSTILEENTFVDQTGEEKSLKAILESHKGKVIFVDFWASWCGPCKREMPYSKQLHEEFEGEDIVFLYLSIDSKDDKWQQSIERLDLAEAGAHHRRDRNDAVELLKFFYIYSIPHYMIINKDGKIVNRDALPPSDPKLKRQLRKWLKR